MKSRVISRIQKGRPKREKRENFAQIFEMVEEAILSKQRQILLVGSMTFKNSSVTTINKYAFSVIPLFNLLDFRKMSTLTLFFIG